VPSSHAYAFMALMLSLAQSMPAMQLRQYFHALLASLCRPTYGEGRQANAAIAVASC
jgi:hypothetical protein